MDRIKSEGTIEVNGKRMFFDGDPHSEPEKPATTINAPWFNGVQEEICNAITSQGISLDSDNSNQLQKAMEL